MTRSTAQSQLLDSLTFDGEQKSDGRGIAAGVLFIDPDAEVLLLRRSSTEENFAGHWALPGGNADKGESAEEAATRECFEEIGCEPENLTLIDARKTPKGTIFSTYASASKRFDPRLNKEHSGYSWFPLYELPLPMHPAVAELLERVQQADKFTYHDGDLEEIEDEVDDIEDPSVVAHVDEDDFAEDEAFQESKHPRGQPGNAGQFSSSAGGSAKTGSTPVARVLRVTLKAAGFKKTKSKTETSYVHPSGAKVIVHPSSAKKSAEFTIHKPGVDPKSGKGTALQKLLNDVVKQAESGGHVEPMPAAEKLFGEKKGSSEEIGSPIGMGKFLKESGYSSGEMFDIGDGISLIYEKPTGSKVQIWSNGNWVAQTPGHLTKEGTGLENLQALMSGKPAVFEEGKAPWKNTTKTIGKKEEKPPVDPEESTHQELYQKLIKSTKVPTSTQQDALSTYSGSGYRNINTKLRHSPGESDKDPKIKSLDEWLHSNEIPEDITVFRGVDGEYAKILRSILTEGAKFIDRGYISTSVNPSMSFVSSGSLKMKINIPKGSKGAALGAFSNHQLEKEVLLPRNTHLIVTKYDPKDKYVEVTIDQGHL